jgi:hypothetical protein
VKVTVGDVPARDQPSGTFTEKPPPAGAYATYCWLSGMSPCGLVSGALVFDAAAGGDAEGEAADVLGAAEVAAGWGADWFVLLLQAGATSTAAIAVPSSAVRWILITGMPLSRVPDHAARCRTASVSTLRAARSEAPERTLNGRQNRRRDAR